MSLAQRRAWPSAIGALIFVDEVLYVVGDVVDFLVQVADFLR